MVTNHRLFAEFAELILSDHDLPPQVRGEMRQMCGLYDEEKLVLVVSRDQDVGRVVGVAAFFIAPENQVNNGWQAVKAFALTSDEAKTAGRVVVVLAAVYIAKDHRDGKTMSSILLQVNAQVENLATGSLRAAMIIAPDTNIRSVIELYENLGLRRKEYNSHAAFYVAPPLVVVSRAKALLGALAG